MLDSDLVFAYQAAAAIRRGEADATTLLESCLARIDALHEEINAVVWQDREGARQEARRQDALARRGEFAGPLHGIPATVKESFDVAGAPSTWGNPLWRENVAKRDADVVSRLRAAGAVVFGKTNVPLMLAERQTHNEIYGTTNNPWDTTRTPGGSSGGSAAALATRMTMLEVGSDIGSSIRNPAHYCGIFGLRPTFGTISISGHMPPGVQLEVDFGAVGPMARSAIDLELAFTAIAGPAETSSSAWEAIHQQDARSQVREFRVALMLSHALSPIDAAYAEVLQSFADDLAATGATVTDSFHLDLDMEEYFELHSKLLGSALAFMADPDEVHRTVAEIDGLDDATLWPVRAHELAAAMTHGEWLRLDMKRRIARRAFDRLFDEIDILITPVVNTAAFPHDHSRPSFARTLTVNGQRQSAGPQGFWQGISSTVGLPSVVGPIGFVGGLPVGYQAIAGHGRDRTALAFAKAIEHEFGGFTEPPISGEANDRMS